MKTIEHLGFVDSIRDGIAKVRINSESACAACHAKGVCTSVDQEEKIMTVSSGDLDVKPGERIKVVIARQTGLKAVAYGYVLPFLLLLLILIVLTIAGLSELKAGLWSLASLFPYYLFIYIFKDRINTTFTFKMEKLYNDL